MLHYRARLCLVAHLHRDDAVIELLRRRPSSANVIRIARINAYWNTTIPTTFSIARIRFALSLQSPYDLANTSTAE